MIVCHCRIVTDRDIANAMDEGARTLAGVCQATGAGQSCGGCIFGVRAVVAAYAKTVPCPVHPIAALNEVPDAATQPAHRRVA
ncbi:MAG: (2Fe-2S)-binding protein [Micrococcales bacterium]|nr:(2Fe-2S)-binding protein [Micrococcales bacterium]